uniref:Uncharacterized protein n=1 Tax=Avena sativa TaxID=4498 RepID=A0ACD5V029_AVESA
MASPNPSSSSSAAAAADPRPEREVWMALAGPFARLPSEGTQVYYFPRGHADQCGDVHNLADVPLDEAIPCTVSSVELHYRAASDDPYAVISLRPDQGPEQHPAATGHEERTATATRYYVKQLGGTNDRCPFSVPKVFAEDIFPDLVGQTSQDLPMVDVHGKQYNFSHLLNVSKGSHTLSANWNNYSEDERLTLSMGKDAVVLARLAQGGFLIGLRRGGPSNDIALELVDNVREAVERAAARDRVFTVAYYPRQGWPFVVPRKEVHDARALNIDWRPGMDVRMAIPVDAHEHIASRRGTPNFFHGVISVVNNNNQWCKLQVDWNGSSTPNSNVNVWQVEAMEPSSKKRKASDAASSSGTGSTLSGPGVKTE